MWTVAMKRMTTALSMAAAATTAFAAYSAMTSPPPPVVTAPSVEPPAIEYTLTWKCEDCTPDEQYVLEELQKMTKITDRNALATIMGNIKPVSYTHLRAHET